MLLSPDKTFIMNNSLSYHFNFVKNMLVEGILVSRMNETKCIGVLIDVKLNFTSHTDSLVSAMAV